MGDDEKHVEQAALEHEDLDDKSETERTPTRRSRRMHCLLYTSDAADE